MINQLSQACLLVNFGVIAVRGTEARKFLQGQLSQDVLGLRAERMELAGLHNPQGRVQAVLRLVADGPNDVLCILPRELVTDTVAQLRKFLLRAKASVTDESNLWQLEGLGDDSALDQIPGSLRREQEAPGEPGSVYWRHASDGRVLRLRAASSVAGTTTDETQAAWALADIEAGLPELTLATRGEFVAQMLNLDVLGGISFNKGCYTGQEVIARAHYRGRVKRRLQRFRLDQSASDAQVGIDPAAHAKITLVPGQRIRLEIKTDTTPLSRSAQIVNVVTRGATTELLAVTTFDAVGDAMGETGVETVVLARQLPMSYSLPE